MSDTIFKNQSQEEFEKERKEILDVCYKATEDKNNLIPAKDFDYYLNQLKMFRSGKL